MMKTVLFSADENLLNEWQEKLGDRESFTAYDMQSLFDLCQEDMDSCVILADYDTLANEINKMVSSNSLPKYLVVLEKRPEILIGKNLVLHGVKAYGNARMLQLHFDQMLQAVTDNKVWTYPELTAELAKSKASSLSEEAQNILQKRLTEKEQEVALLILEGLTNEAIANKLYITVRTVKAHISSIFQKLHVNDRLSLVLLLK
jgi:DNA-binding NarL/FixJ family response regulator